MRRGVPFGLVALSLLLLALLAGCAQPTDDTEEDPLFGLCPQWAQGHGGQTTSVVLEGEERTATRELGPADAQYLNRSLDLYRVRVERLELGNGSRLELRALAADGTRLSLRDYRHEDVQVVPVVHLGTDAVGKEFDVFLSPLLEDAPGALAPASLEWTVVGEAPSAFVEVTVTYHYKVCGI